MQQAIDQLKQISTAKSDPFIQVFLGDLSLARGSANDAKSYYQSAAQVARQQENQLAEAVAQHALGMIYRGEETPAKARPALQTAIARYEAVGEPESAAMLRKTLASLKK